MVHNGGSRAAPVLHGLRITTRFHASPPTRGGVEFYMRVCVLFIGTRFSNLYTAMNTPAKAA
jgi:hypothetical protein